MAGPALGDCFVGVMGKLGASSQALAFARRMDNSAYLREFRDTGGVDVAWIFYPFRANENYGCLLVNGEPPIIDVDDLQELPQAELDADSTYRALASRYRVTIWPADRVGKSGPAVLRLAGGGRRFVVMYRLQDFCHACELIGMAAFGFDFDAAGRFLGRRLMVVQSGSGAGEEEAEAGTGEASSRSPRLEVQAGKEFSITLASNRTTGYQWQLAAPLDERILQLVGSEYVSPSVSRPGAGGTEVWTFRAVGRGSAEIVLQYLRPWEKGVTPAETAGYLVVVR